MNTHTATYDDHISGAGAYHECCRTYKGHLERLSDGKAPKEIVFIQCVEAVAPMTVESHTVPRSAVCTQLSMVLTVINIRIPM